MDETRRHFLRQLAILGIAPTALAAFPPSSNAAYAAQPPAASEPNGPAKWTRSRPFNPPKIVRKPAELFAARLVLPFHKASIRGRQRAPKLLTYTPGKWLGATEFSGGEEAALINNATGEWLAGGDPHNMLVWAESHGALPNHWIDPEDGRLYSIVKNPKVSAYSKTATFTAESHSPIKLDGAHYQAICYVAYLATGDRYYLEELQCQANYHQVMQNPQWRKNDRGLFTKGQARAWAWALRDTTSAYLATPDGDVPPPLLPKSYWKRILDNNRDDFKSTWMNPANNPLAGCHFARMLNGMNIAPWQQDWIGAVIGWMVWTGRFNDWRENYEWQIKQAIDRTSGKSGYPRSRAIGYWLKTAEVTNMASFAAANHLTETPDGKFPPKTNMHYAESLRANLKIATLNGVPGAAECFAYVDKQVTTIDPKWAV